MLERLGQTLWQPMLEHWPQLRHSPLALIPAGDVALLPLFTALIDGVPAAAMLDVVVVPSARALALAAARPAPPQGAAMMVIADPAHDRPGLPPIERTITEAEQVAAIHAARPAVLSATSQPAEISELVEQIGTANMVHLACHGTIEHADPLASRLCLGDAGLPLRSIWDHRFRAAPLVVLSACHLGGIGTDTPGEQLGFPAVLLASGARSVVAALWEVSESPDTVTLMADFHHRLRSGEPANRALGNAIGTLSAQGITPSTWAPFSFFGQQRQHPEPHHAHPASTSAAAGNNRGAGTVLS